MKDENRVLREQNLVLTEELVRLREARLENTRLHQLLELKKQSPFTYVGANVVGKTMGLLYNTITLDVGEKDGVKTNMPIVTDGGLVGRVTVTSDGYAVGQILWNRDFRASAKVERGRVDGILLWEGGDYLTLKNVAKTLDLQTGDLVVTSEYSNMFPAGIKIGVVHSTQQVPGALFQTIDIIPTADLSRVEHAFVILTTPDSTRATLEHTLTK